MSSFRRAIRLARMSRMERLQVVSHRIAVLVLGGTSILMAVVIVAGMMGTDWCARLTGRRGYVVSSGSMQPAINTGSYVLVRLLDPLARNTVNIGSVVAYRAATDPSLVITHRVVGIETTDGQSTYTTKGDANAVADMSKVPSSHLIGVHELDVPYVGYAIESMHRTPVSASFIGAFLLASVSVSSGGDGRRDTERKKRRRQER